MYASSVYRQLTCLMVQGYGLMGSSFGFVHGVPHLPCGLCSAVSKTCKRFAKQCLADALSSCVNGIFLPSATTVALTSTNTPQSTLLVWTGISSGRHSTHSDDQLQGTPATYKINQCVKEDTTLLLKTLILENFDINDTYTVDLTLRPYPSALSQK